jgi:hypothetical protein
VHTTTKSKSVGSKLVVALVATVLLAVGCGEMPLEGEEALDPAAQEQATEPAASESTLELLSQTGPPAEPQDDGPPRLPAGLDTTSSSAGSDLVQGQCQPSAACNSLCADSFSACSQRCGEPGDGKTGSRQCQQSCNRAAVICGRACRKCA